VCLIARMLQSQLETNCPSLSSVLEMLKSFLIWKVKEQKGEEKVGPRSPQSNWKRPYSLNFQSLKFGRFTSSYSVT
jgi:hypothetical protein